MLLLLLPLPARGGLVLLLVVHAVCWWLGRQHVCYSLLLRRLCGV